MITTFFAAAARTATSSPDSIRSPRNLAFCTRLYEGIQGASKGRSAGEQFYRASAAVESNYRAAKRGRSTAEFIAKLGVVVEEIDEAVGWLEHMRDARIVSDPALLSEAEQLRKIFGRSLGTARRNQREREPTSSRQLHLSSPLPLNPAKQPVIDRHMLCDQVGASSVCKTRQVP